MDLMVEGSNPAAGVSFLGLPKLFIYHHKEKKMPRKKTPQKRKKKPKKKMPRKNRRQGRRYH